MKSLKNYNVIQAPMAAVLIIGLGVMIPVFIFGMGSVIRFFQLIWSPPTTGSIPIWVIILGGLLVIMYLKQRRQYAYLP